MVSYLSDSWFILPAVGGAVMGSIENIYKTGSLWITPEKEAVDKSTIVNQVNRWRERDRKDGGLFIPGDSILLHVPVALFSLIDGVRGSESKSVMDVSYRVAKNLGCILLLPAAETLLSTHLSVIFRIKYTEALKDRTGHDLSGHALLQTLFSLYVLRTATALNPICSPSQRQLFELYCAALSITDGVWVYKTASRHHSVAEMVSATALVSATNFAVYQSVNGISNLANMFF